MSGDRFLEVIQANADYSDIPVIQMTAAHMSQLAGTRALLKKPINLDQLFDLLTKIA